MQASGSIADRLIDDYLREIRVAAWNRGVPRDQALSLVKEVRMRIEGALTTAGGDRDEATVYGVLDHLGPASAFVDEIDVKPRSGARGALDRVLAPVARLGYVHGWGIAEIGALVLLIVGPLYLWWIGPVFGIILVRVAADRWSDRTTHRATNFVVAVFAVQALVAVCLFVYVLTLGGPFDAEISKVVSSFRPGIGGISPLSPFLGGAGPLSPLQIVLGSPPFVAGIASGIYLLLSPRQRARPMN